MNTYECYESAGCFRKGKRFEVNLRDRPPIRCGPWVYYSGSLVGSINQIRPPTQNGKLPQPFIFHTTHPTAPNPNGESESPRPFLGPDLFLSVLCLSSPMIFCRWQPERCVEFQFRGELPSDVICKVLFVIHIGSILSGRCDICCLP